MVTSPYELKILYREENRVENEYKIMEMWYFETTKEILGKKVRQENPIISEKTWDKTDQIVALKKY